MLKLQWAYQDISPKSKAKMPQSQLHPQSQSDPRRFSYLPGSDSTSRMVPQLQDHRLQSPPPSHPFQHFDGQYEAASPPPSPRYHSRSPYRPRMPEDRREANNGFGPSAMTSRDFQNPESRTTSPHRGRPLGSHRLAGAPSSGSLAGGNYNGGQPTQVEQLERQQLERQQLERQQLERQQLERQQLERQQPKGPSRTR